MTPLFATAREWARAAIEAEAQVAISTYDELKTALGDWLERGDLAARAGDFIALAEARMNRQLRLAAMEGEAEIAVAAGARTLALPADFREARGLWRAEACGRAQLRYRPPNLLPRSDVGGPAEYWTLQAGEIGLERPCAAAGTFVLAYVRRLALSPAAPSNEVLTAHPDVYLFGALAEAAPYLRDGEMTGQFTARFEGAMAEAKAADAARHGLARLRTEAPLAAEGSPC